MQASKVSVGRLERVATEDIGADVIIADTYCLERGFMVCIWLDEHKVQGVRFHDLGMITLSAEVEHLRAVTRRTRDLLLCNGVLNPRPKQFVSRDYAERYSINNVLVSPMISPSGKYVGNLVMASRDKPFAAHEITLARMVSQVLAVFLGYYQDAQCLVQQLLVQQLVSGSWFTNTLREATAMVNFLPGEPCYLLLLQPRDWNGCCTEFAEMCQER